MAKGDGERLARRVVGLVDKLEQLGGPDLELIEQAEDDLFFEALADARERLESIIAQLRAAVDEYRGHQAPRQVGLFVATADEDGEAC